MLVELTIKNIALIESLCLEFAQGFNVLTGETGAGKSIVVDCVNLALGGRADRDIIRTGSEKGMVQALFDISGNDRALQFARALRERRTRRHHVVDDEHGGPASVRRKRGEVPSARERADYVCAAILL